MTISSIYSLDREIEILKSQDPLRSWNPFFESFTSKIVSKYKKLGKYRIMALIQYTDHPLRPVLSSLKKEYSFIDYDFNDTAGELILRSLIDNIFAAIYIGDNAIDMITEICDEFEQKELKKQMAESKKEEDENQRMINKLQKEKDLIAKRAAKKKLSKLKEVKKLDAKSKKEECPYC